MGPGSRAQAQTPRVASIRTTAVQARWRGRTGYWRDTEVGDQTGPESKFCYVDLDLSEVLSSMRSYRRITRVQSYGTGSAWMPTQASRIHCVCSHFRGTLFSELRWLCLHFCSAGRDVDEVVSEPDRRRQPDGRCRHFDTPMKSIWRYTTKYDTGRVSDSAAHG